MKLLDTNVVMYAIGGPHQYKEACQRLLQDVAAGNTTYNIDVELLQEILYVYSYRGERRHALEVVDLLLRVFPDPLPIGREELIAARNVLERHPNLSPRDAIHLGVALTHGLEGIVTTDRSMSQSSEVNFFEPGQVYPE